MLKSNILQTRWTQYKSVFFFSILDSFLNGLTGQWFLKIWSFSTVSPDILLCHFDVNIAAIVFFSNEHKTIETMRPKQCDSTFLPLLCIIIWSSHAMQVVSLRSDTGEKEASCWNSNTIVRVGLAFAVIH